MLCGPEGSFDNPDESVIRWILSYHAYSEIAHSRTLLAGLITLDDTGNVPSGMILSRHVFEWTAHSCFMVEKLDWLIKSNGNRLFN